MKNEHKIFHQRLHLNMHTKNLKPPEAKLKRYSDSKLITYSWQVVAGFLWQTFRGNFMRQLFFFSSVNKNLIRYSVDV